MKRRGIILMSLSFIAGIGVSLTRSGKKTESLPTDSPVFFMGKWRYVDPTTHKHHELQIGSDLDLTIDGHPINAKVEAVSSYQISYLDSFGYHITIEANEARPISLYDEAGDTTYTLLELN